MIAGASAGNVEQVALGIIHLLKIGVVTDASRGSLLKSRLNLVCSAFDNVSENVVNKTRASG